MEDVFLVWHTHIDEDLRGGEDVKFIGVFSTEAKALEIIEKFKLLPGFMEQPENFEISINEINKCGWEEGFFTYEPPD
ncbi:MAG: hypothetical protein H6581_10810 [Bacteroidia bacterium]|nr:hypothetical protein [Bacteroidia bacterium]